MEIKDINKLSEDEQIFIYKNHLENKSLEEIHSIEKYLDYLIFMGLI